MRFVGPKNGDKGVLKTKLCNPKWVLHFAGISNFMLITFLGLGSTQLNTLEQSCPKIYRGLRLFFDMVLHLKHLK